MGDFVPFRERAGVAKDFSDQKTSVNFIAGILIPDKDVRNFGVERRVGDFSGTVIRYFGRERTVDRR